MDIRRLVREAGDDVIEECPNCHHFDPHDAGSVGVCVVMMSEYTCGCDSMIESHPNLLSPVVLDESVELLNDYQDKALSTALEAALGDDGLVYATLGLNGEAGEVAEKVKKKLRDGQINFRDTALELGDVLWYVSLVAYHLGYTLGEVAQMNVDKLASRKDREVLKGSGDDR